MEELEDLAIVSEMEKIGVYFWRGQTISHTHSQALQAFIKRNRL